MRQVIFNQLINLAEKDKNLFLITGDLGYPQIEAFKNKFPQRYINAGLTEQSLVSLAAGLALSDKIVFVYSIATFATMRPWEQIRNDLCYQNLNVKIIGSGAGLSYATHGITHYGLEDLGLMRLLPNMKVFSPANKTEAELVTQMAYDQPGPAYIRSSKNAGLEPKKLPEIQFPQAYIVQPGTDICLLVTGVLLDQALKAAQVLAKKNVSVQVVSFPTIKPIDKALVIEVAKKFKAVFSLEETSLIGGLGSSVAEIIAETGLKTQFKRLALPDNYHLEIGSAEYLRDQFGLSVEKIVQQLNAFATGLNLNPADRD